MDMAVTTVLHLFFPIQCILFSQPGNMPHAINSSAQYSAAQFLAVWDSQQCKDHTSVLLIQRTTEQRKEGGRGRGGGAGGSVRGRGAGVSLQGGAWPISVACGSNTDGLLCCWQLRSKRQRGVKGARGDSTWQQGMLEESHAWSPSSGSFSVQAGSNGVMLLGE